MSEPEPIPYDEAPPEYDAAPPEDYGVPLEFDPVPEATPAAQPTPEVHAEEEPPPLQFPTLDAFVEGLIALIYERPTAGISATWCPKWWMHDEAVFRLTALWQAWESMHVSEGPLAPAKWLTYYGDPIMGALFNPEGCFKGCSVEKGHRADRPHPDGMLPCESAPEGVFTPRE